MLVLKLNVFVTVVQEVCSGDRIARMVLFDGICEGDYFNGIILPGGVDTQKINDGKGTLSARYMLKGTDRDGNECSVFIENNAVMGTDETVPTVLTDSPVLKWMETAELYGRIIPGEQCLRIEIHAKD